MKQKLAALLALIFVISMAACSAKPAPAPETFSEPPAAAEEQPAKEETPEDTPAKVVEPEVEAPPAEENGFDVDFTDTPQHTQADIEEIVSYDISVPQLTLASAEAADYINAGFAKLSDNLIKYAQETVYPSAQEKMTIGFLQTSYDVTAQDGKIVVDFTVEERYASEDEAKTDTTRYVFDAATGERLTED